MCVTAFLSFWLPKIISPPLMHSGYPFRTDAKTGSFALVPVLFMSLWFTGSISCSPVSSLSCWCSSSRRQLLIDPLWPKLHQVADKISHSSWQTKLEKWLPGDYMPLEGAQSRQWKCSGGSRRRAGLVFVVVRLVEIFLFSRFTSMLCNNAWMTELVMFIGVKLLFKIDSK